MTNIVIITVGKLDKQQWKLAAQDYLKRLNFYAKLTIHNINDETSNNIFNNIKKETKKIDVFLEKYFNYESFLLDINSNLISSEDLSKIIINNQEYKENKLLFIIGGSNGVDSNLKLNNKIKKISFGKITLPHQLCFVVLLEQIYRAFQIINKTPYHK